MRAVTETNLGSALQTEGRLDDAVDHYRRAIALAPEFPAAYNNLATTLRAKGQLADAVATYQQALRLRAEYPEAHYNLANALMDAGKPAEAIEHFRIALQTMPASVDVLNNLGIADRTGQARRGGRRVSRGAACRSTRRSTATSATCWDPRVNATRRSRTTAAPCSSIRPTPPRTTTSAACCSKPIGSARSRNSGRAEGGPEVRRGTRNLGIALGSRGHMDEAIEQFRHALALQPGFEDARCNLATALQVRRRD
jgi:tetratricopeptide (TPR) repeat protein